MNTYEVTLTNGNTSTYHADNISACLKKVEAWEPPSTIVEVKKVANTAPFNFNSGTYLDIGAYGEREVRVFFDYQPYEEQTLEHPGCDEDWTVTSVCWCDTKQELTEPERCLLEEYYGPLNEYIACQANDDQETV